ncbi:MAG: hypothetical protein IJ408_05655 [Clostridia bacterium]|nr:hypothetical protein [Clostridia bacterium]
MSSNDFTADFFDTVTVRLLSIIRRHRGKSYDMTLVPDLLERGKVYIMSWLKDENLRDAFKNEPIMFYYNVACNAFGGGVAYADAWDKDPVQIKTGIVDTLIASMKDINLLATDILGIDEKGQEDYRRMLDELFSEFLSVMEPYWDKEDPRPFLFQGLLAFYQTGINLRLGA